MQDRFSLLVPALTKYGSTTVGLTLLVIGIGGLYETWTESGEMANEAQPAFAGGFFQPLIFVMHAHRVFTPVVALLLCL